MHITRTTYTAVTVATATKKQLDNIKSAIKAASRGDVNKPHIKTEYSLKTLTVRTNTITQADRYEDLLEGLRRIERDSPRNK